MGSWLNRIQGCVAAGLWAGAGLSLGAAETPFFAERVAPIFEERCVTCHGPKKHKSGLRLDSYAGLMRGGEGGAVIKAGDAKGSELLRRITLPPDDEDVMPSEGKPSLTPVEIKTLTLWVTAGASAFQAASAVPGASELPTLPKPAAPLAPDYRPRLTEIAALEKTLGVRLAPRSQVATDGLVLRTASAPGSCDDATLARLAPVASLIVDAELARTRVTDAGLTAVGGWTNLRTLDLSRTPVSSVGVAALSRLTRLHTLNLTDTAVDDTGVARLKMLPELQRLWLFGSKATWPEPAFK